MGGARPPPFTVSTITSKVVVYSPAERAGLLPLFLFYPYMYSVSDTIKHMHNRAVTYIIEQCAYLIEQCAYIIEQCAYTIQQCAYIIQ